MPLYIKGSGNISPQRTWGDAFDLTVSYPTHRLSCIEPDYGPWVAPAQQRRMSRIIKMGVASALLALKEAVIPKPEGILTGTGLGCLQDTGQFLAQTIEKNEEALNPTPFIQSTHNTIGSQIALLLQVQGYNQTYAHDGSSFEAALLDAQLQLSDDPGQSLLVGGIDEITDYSHSIHSRFGIYRKGINDSLSLFKGKGKGTLQGEGSAWFVLTGMPQSGTARIDAVSTAYRCDQNRAGELVDQFLLGAGVKREEVDFILLGQSGDDRFDQIGKRIAGLFPSASKGVFKHLCGEYPVSSAFALWLAAAIAKSGQIPPGVLTHDGSRRPERILIYNQYFGLHHSLLLLTAC